MNSIYCVTVPFPSAMARRGELVVAVPVAFVKAGDRIEKDPDRRIREEVVLIFYKITELGTARQWLAMVP